jgi:hypothetical protein
MAVYRYDPATDRMVDKETGEPMVSGPYRPATPMHVPDIQPYLSPVDGRYVSGRRAKADDLARTGCIDAADLPRPTGGKFRNKEFAQKRGLTHLLKEEAQ